MQDHDKYSGGRPRIEKNGGTYGQKSYGGFRDDKPQKSHEETPEECLRDGKFQSTWISNGADELLPEFADKMGKYMALQKLTKTKIRSVYGEMKRIQMGDFEKLKSSFFLLKPKVAYALGREKDNKGLKLFKLIFDVSSIEVKDQRTYNNFCNLMEAILAYHKAYGGGDC